MRTYLPRLGTIILACGIAAIVVVAGALTHTFNIVAAGVVAIVVVLLVSAGIEGARRYWLTHGAGLAVEVRRANGRRELVTLDPADEASITRFSEAMKEDFARRVPPEAAATLREPSRSEERPTTDKPS